MTKETFFEEGHRQYLQMQLDTAYVLLRKAVAMDSLYAAPVNDLAQLTYDRALSAKDDRKKTAAFKESFRWFARSESFGNTDAAVYDRLCEIAERLDDDKSFLRYARRAAERYPFDRQSYNLGLAAFAASDFQSVIKSQKEAVDKFKLSPYLGSFYRQMGRAYMKIDRDQTAERTLEAGVAAVDLRMAAVKKEQGASSGDYHRLSEDRVGMLQLLRKLYTTYKENEKLQSAERQLREAGALK
jgi:tetratricopeptide (TPR) repeat protein